MSDGSIDRRDNNPIATEAQAVSALTTAAIAARIAELQAIQKRHRPDSADSRAASELLAPLFAEMGNRQHANGGEPDWRKWTLGR